MSDLSNLRAIDFKRTERIALTTVLREYISCSYAEHPDAYTDDLRIIDDLRTDCLNLEVHPNALNRLLKAIPEGVKRACQHFQFAAGCFKHLKDSIVPEMRIAPTMDMSPATLDVLINMMLAQAQECFWQKAIHEQLKDGTIAKLASQVSDYYEAAHELTANNPDVAKMLGQNWVMHLKVKSWHFIAAAEFRKSSECISQNKYGEEIARLQVAEGYVKRGFEQSKYLGDAVVKDLESLRNVILSSLSRAVKDNDIIYLNTIPSASSLVAIGRANLANPNVLPEVGDPIPLMNEKSILGMPLFAKLVPFAVHQAYSVYSDRKEQLKERIISQLQDLSNVCTSTLQSLNLPASLHTPEQSLPSSLFVKSQDVRNEGGLTRLEAMFETIEECFPNSNKILEEAFNILDAEAGEDEEWQSQFGERWLRESSENVNKGLIEQANKHKKILEQARMGDNSIRNKIEQWSGFIKLLGEDKETLISSIPSGDTVVGTAQESLQGVTIELRSLVNEAYGFMKDCQNTIQEVKKTAGLDDIGPILLKEAARITAANGTATKIEPSQFEDLFTEQMKRYDKFLELAEKESERQDRILNNVGEKFKELSEKRVSKNDSERVKALTNLENAYNKFREILMNLQEGIKFYSDFDNTLNEFKKNCEEFARFRHDEGERHVNRLTGRGGNPNRPQSVDQSLSYGGSPYTLPVNNSRASQQSGKMGWDSPPSSPNWSPHNWPPPDCSSAFTCYNWSSPSGKGGDFFEVVKRFEDDMNRVFTDFYNEWRCPVINEKINWQDACSMNSPVDGKLQSHATIPLPFKVFSKMSQVTINHGVIEMKENIYAQ
ncbi:3280_t:CDS:10 [Acaulospora colombiana]|uniref:3280_t:CDS:1 n=1 Tax=Acaulospora colombiana TaxID=27376 RepID=A0ACA9KQK4_9GLOM|nr:3280_t:CDS:10 [Acaulospora colombiana]